jgi:hypothetical protein
LHRYRAVCKDCDKLFRALVDFVNLTTETKYIFIS